MTAADGDAARTGPRRPLVVALAAVVLVLALACAAGGVLVVKEELERRDESGSPRTQPPSAEVQNRYGEVRAAAEATARALVNIDYRDPQASFDAVAATSTGTFLDQYQASSDSLVELVTNFESVLEGEVAVSAVDDLDADSASVLVATEGTVRNAQTGEDAQARNFRLLVKLVRDGNRWLTNDLEFVG